VSYPHPETRRYPEGMEHEAEPQRETTEFLGIPVTAEGKARARQNLDDADRRRDPQRRAKLRALLHLAPAR
jgi:hypothetical protein